MAFEVQHADFMQRPDLTPDVYSQENHKSLQSKILYLLRNVHLDHRSTLQSIIRSQRFEKFERSRGPDDHEYFERFFNTLTVQQLENLLLAFKPFLEQNMWSKPQTAAAYNHVYHGTTHTTAKTAVEEAINAFGEAFSTSARKAEDEAYNEANNKYPARALEERELKLCGKPFAAVLKKYLPMLDDDFARARFNIIIRNLVLDQNISTFELQKRLRHTTRKLVEFFNLRASKQSDIAKQSSFKKNAEDLHFEAFGVAHLNVESEPVADKNEQNSFNQRLTAPVQWLRSLFAKKTPTTSSMKQQSAAKGAIPESTDPQKAHDLYTRMSKLPKGTQSNAEDKPIPPSPKRPDLTFAYDTRYKRPGNILPEDYGYKFSKTRPK